ncbi:MAG: SpoIIE family protein phosphatase [Crocinitomicaceae bacterium]|nr:SpoIIE family protein phosphatase [Crocinitomicaceae bacterium]
MRNYWPLILLYVLNTSCLGVYAQDAVEDSLTSAVFNAKTKHEKIMKMGDLALYHNETNPQKALEIVEQACNLAEIEHDRMFVINLKGVVFYEIEQYDSALFYFQEVNNIATESGDSLYISKSLNNIAAIQMISGNYQEGLAMMNQAAIIDLKKGDLKEAMVSFGNLGAIHFQLRNYNNSKDFCLQSIDLARKIGEKDHEADVCGTLGGVEFRLGNQEAGKEWYSRAMELHAETGNLQGVQRDYFNLATIYRQEGKNKIAEVYYLKSLEFAERIDSPNSMKELYYGLASNNEEMGKEGMALSYYKVYMDWNDSVINRENAQVIIEMQEKFSSQQTKKENELLIQDNKIKDLENQKNKAKLGQSRIMVFGSAIGLAMLIIIALVLFNRNRIKQRANRELQQAHDIIREKNDDITSSIEYASKIQEALLPTKENVGLFKDSFFILMPKDIVSGDFLWYSQLGDKVVFAAADCTGHGVPGAFMSMIGNSFLHQIIVEKKMFQPSMILDQLREMIIVALNQQKGENARKDGMDIAICVLDKKTGELEYAGANNPLYYVTGGEIFEIKADKQPVGYMPERNEPFTNHRIKLMEGDALYIFSDGFADQFGGPKGKKFKYKQMRDLLHNNFDKPMMFQKELMLKVFQEWKGDLEQIDDVCMIGVRV